MFIRVSYRRLSFALLAGLLALLLAACESGTTPTPVSPSATPPPAATNTSEPSATSVPPTDTAVPPTATTAPTDTAVPTATVAPTDTAVPPTATAIPTNPPLPTVTQRPTNTTRPTDTPQPTDTAVPPTSTPKPPTATAVPLTATEGPQLFDTPTAIPGGEETPTPGSGAEETPTEGPQLFDTPTPAPVTASLIEKAPPGKKMVALTFDAGAGRGRVADILATLRQYNVHITFFLTGQWAEQNPDMVRAIVADGNEVANHSYDHPYFTKLSDAEMIEEIAKCEQIVQGIAGVTTKPYFRPPYGDYNKHVLQVVAGQGYQPIYWTFDSLDSVGQPKSKEFIIKRVTENNYEMDGAIVLQHMAADGSADALPTEIERLEARGLKIVPLSELLAK